MQEFDIEPFLYANGSKQCINTKNIVRIDFGKTYRIVQTA